MNVLSLQVGRSQVWATCKRSYCCTVWASRFQLISFCLLIMNELEGIHANFASGFEITGFKDSFNYSWTALREISAVKVRKGTEPPDFFLFICPYICLQSLDYQLRSASNPCLIKSTKSLASLSEQTAFISVMDRWTPREICLLLSHLANSFHGLSEKEKQNMAHSSGADGGEWQRSTRLTRLNANTINLPLQLFITHAHTHTCSDVCVEPSQGQIHANQKPRQEEGCSLWGGGGVLSAICGKYTTGTERALTEGVQRALCSFAATSCLAFKRANTFIETARGIQTAISMITRTLFHPLPEFVSEDEAVSSCLCRLFEKAWQL